MLDERQAGLLTDVLDSARSIRTYLTGVTYESFLGDAEKQDAVLRRFEIIGEAASRLHPKRRRCFRRCRFVRCGECGISSRMTMAKWT